MTTENQPNLAALEVSRQACDKLIDVAVDTMATQAGASLEMILDRLLTYSAASVCSIEGSPRAAEVFRTIADQIDAGLFHRVTGENRPARRGH